MKNKIYAISLLLSFLIVLSHEFIAHHHGDFALYSSNSYVCDNDHEHNNEDYHHHDSKEEKNSEHNHPFPIHNHCLVDGDFILDRTNVNESKPLNKIKVLFAVSIVFQNDVFIPPDSANSHCKISTFFISSLFNPEANALRGPPFMI